MIAVFDKDTLLSALIPAMYTVSGKNTMPSIEGIHLTCRYDEKCMIQSYDLEKGMRVIYKKYSGTEVKDGKNEYLLIKAEDILAVVE